MEEMINYGIDLGTSNSLIAKFSAGRVEVFKNPRGHKESLPSVVGFRKDKILVGDKANEYVEKDSKNVASRFKRKMGTSETIKIESINSSKTPVELSAFVLKELKGFVHSGETVDAAVITIPTSFDTIQSNATKEAGNQSGLSDVVLLQEPIAASLAYANKDNSEDLKNSQWIVYDLGGGTFDVALVKIIEGELNVVDHEGNNYFGGADLDTLMLEKVIVPEIEQKGEFTDLLSEMKSATGRYNREWYQLLHRAEGAKIELSGDQSTEVEFAIEDETGDEINLSITITRSEFEALIKDKITETTQMLKKILTRQSLQPKDLKFVLMVGGSTYIPLVRKHVEEVMGIPVNTDIDPINAIGVGAAFFAGTKQKGAESSAAASNKKQYSIKVRTTYERNSQEDEALFSAKIEGDIIGMTYRIYSEDGAFDSGIKTLKSRIIEDLPLRKKEYNLFQFQIRDAQGNVVETGFGQIQIAQGCYSIAGQMLPAELSLVRDDLRTQDTRLDRIFDKNCVLPTMAKRTVEAGKTLIKDSEDEIKIMVVEGSSENHHMSNKPIGTFVISGTMVNRDLLKGTEIDITFELSESRDLTISAYLNGTGQEFSQVFNPKERDVKPKELSTDILQLEEMILSEQEEAAENDNHEIEKKLESVLGEVQILILEAGNLIEDDVTDDRYKVEDKKRALAQEVYQLTSSKRVNNALSEYQKLKKSVTQLIQENGNDHEKHLVREIVGREEVFLRSNNPISIETETNELYAVRYQILIRVPGYLVGMFEHLVENRVSMNDQVLVKQLIENGKRLIEGEAWEDLRMVIERLWDLVPETEKDSYEYRLITGIV